MRGTCPIVLLMFLKYASNLQYQLTSSFTLLTRLVGKLVSWLLVLSHCKCYYSSLQPDRPETRETKARWERWVQVIRK